MTKLSVNINKIATIRNARGGNTPNLLSVARDIERFGAQGITVHPRPDERHITYNDVRQLQPMVTTEFNIEGNPTPDFIDLVLENPPHQVTLVPDSPDVLTSNAGWDTIKNQKFLTETVAIFKNAGIRTSLFIETNDDLIKAAADTGADRVELYTEDFATQFAVNKEAAVKPYTQSALTAQKVGLSLNAGHDLSLENLEYFAKNVPGLLEVSIGHALISDALYFGLENTVQMYLRKLR